MWSMLTLPRYLMMPNRQTIHISALYGEQEEEIPGAMCGDQIRVRIRGVEEEDILPVSSSLSPSACETSTDLISLRDTCSAHRSDRFTASPNSRHKLYFLTSSPSSLPVSIACFTSMLHKKKLPLQHYCTSWKRAQDDDLRRHLDLRQRA